MKSILLSISLLLNSYSLPFTMEKAPDYKKKFELVEKTEDLKKVNNRFFNREPVAFKKLCAGDDLAASGKGSTIYFAYANDGTPLAIVKQLPLDDYIDREELQDEVSSLQEKYFSRAKNFCVPRLIGTAEFATEDRANGYIIESIAKGKSINTLVKEATGSSGIKKLRSYQTLKNSVRQTAKAFAEMHSIKKLSTYSSYYDKAYADVKTSSFKGPYGIIHGDAHLGNIFYDPSSNKTTFIDLSFMPRSLEKGAPVGLDSGKFIFTLEALCSFYGLDQEKTDELVRIYQETYIAQNPAMSKKLLQEYTLIAYKDYAFPSDTFASDKTDQGSFLYRFASAKVALA